MFNHEDIYKYMDEFDFIPNVLGLKDVEHNSFRLIILPSFHPEEVWDIDLHGKGTTNICLESIWGSIPQKLKFPGESEWKYYKNANFTIDKIKKNTFQVKTINASKLLKAYRRYKKTNEISCDGIGIICSFWQNNKIVKSRINNPQKSDFYDCILALVAELQKLGYKSSVDVYL